MGSVGNRAAREKQKHAKVRFSFRDKIYRYA